MLMKMNVILTDHIYFFFHTDTKKEIFAFYAYRYKKGRNIAYYDTNKKKQRQTSIKLTDCISAVIEMVAFILQVGKYVLLDVKELMQFTYLSVIL